MLKKYITRAYIEALADDQYIPTDVVTAITTLSRSSTYRLEATGKLRAIRLGGKRLYSVKTVRDYMRSLEAEVQS
jgi:predicted DNA-binding transcriptional regulator AlpA